MPMSTSELIQYFNQNKAQYSGPDLVGLLVKGGLYKNANQIKEQLLKAGYSKAQIEQAFTHKGPDLGQEFAQAATDLLIVPGSLAEAVVGGGGETAAGTAAESTAGEEDEGSTSSGTPGGGIPSGLSNLLSKYGSDLIFAPLIAWLMTGKNWVRVLEYVGGAAMILVALRSFANQ